MENKEGDSKNKSSENFNLENELSTLVNKNVLPSRIAEKLKKKIKEKNVKISKEQLYNIVNRIRDVMNDYIKSVQPKEETKAMQPSFGKADTNMQKLVENIEKLEKRISIIETGKTSDHKFVTTEDIKLPSQEWDLEPLKEVPTDPESIIILMKWLQYLIDRCGRNNLSNILDYYVDIGWITPDVKICLIDYSHGITEEFKKDGASKISNLPSKDHIQSLIFIQKLKGIDFDRHFIDRIDNELNRITKKLDTYQFK